MSTPQTKRKVMGRIDLSNLSDGNGSQTNRNQPSTRAHTSSPAPGFSSSGRQTPKAKVNVNSIVNGTAPKVTSNNILLNRQQHLSGSSVQNSPTIRSPVPSQTGFNSLASPPIASERSASISPSTFFHVRNSDGSSSSSPITTRSPSPSKMYTGPYRSANSSVSSGLQSQNKRSESPSFPITAKSSRVRTASNLQGQDGILSGITVRTSNPSTITAKVSPLLSDSTPKSNHVRVNSINVPATAHAVHSPPQSRSRSPSPTLTKANAKDARRISYGSNVSHQSSTSGAPSGSGTQRASIGRSSFSAAPTRPSLVSMTSQFTNVSIGEAQSNIGKDGGGLESPVDLSSPTAQFGNVLNARTTSLTSPSNQGFLSSPPIIHSPTIELGAEQIEAKTNRKILDLEITNKSLLAINSGLEVVKLKQAREIRDLKRKLREGRTLGESLGLRDGNEEEIESDSDEEEEESVMDEEAPLNAELEEAHQRCKGLIDAMVAQARQAILSKYEPEPVVSGNRVLHPAEVVEMQNKNENLLEDDEEEEKSFTQEEEDQSLPETTAEDRSRFLDRTNDTTVSQCSSEELETEPTVKLA